MRMLLSFLFTFIVSFSFAQNEIKTFVNTNAVAIKSIDPDSTNFSDLELIGNSIGDARIVMLGEQDHGDAPTFLAKTRLIKYLHEKKGFNVIAFESDFYSATVGFQNMERTKQGFVKFAKTNIVPFWTICDGCHNLFNTLIPESFNTTNPFIVAGFDDQMIYRHATSTLSKFIDSLARAGAIDIVKNESIYSSALASINKLSNPLQCDNQPASFYKTAISEIGLLRNDFAKKVSAESISLVLLDNMIAWSQQLLNKKDFTEMVNLRDTRMSETLKWLCKTKFPNEKIIVWAANFHISKNMGQFKKRSLNDNKSMATEFVKDPVLAAATYSLGFTSYEGEAGRIGTKSFTVDKPDKNGLETWINPSLEYAFVDFTQFNKANPGFKDEFEMKSCVSDNYVHKSYPAQWNRIFDGVFFIRHMYPCKIKN